MTGQLPASGCWIPWSMAAMAATADMCSELCKLSMCHMSLCSLLDGSRMLHISMYAGTVICNTQYVLFQRSHAEHKCITLSGHDMQPAPDPVILHDDDPDDEHERMVMMQGGAAKGSKAEPVNCPSADTDLLPALISANVTAVFSGHDHDNNFDVMHPAGVRLAYGHKTAPSLKAIFVLQLNMHSHCYLPAASPLGHCLLSLLSFKAVEPAIQWVFLTGYGSYGPPAEWLHGGRVILLREGQPAREAESWIRLENGTRIDQAPAFAQKIAAQQQTVCDASMSFFTSWS
ncbi:hypothetical protein MMC07_000427 [Pseudocyphellaria aurata]|nr:hypothetical protein [Pseudocyphellaria aurata]